MNQEKLNQAIDALTQSVAENRPAADALQLLLADYYLAQTQIVDLNKRITALGSAAPLAQVLAETETKRAEAIRNLGDLSADGKQVLQDLSAAQQSAQVALQRIGIVTDEYLKLNANAKALVDNSKKLLGGAVKSFLGPYAQIGPVKDIADKLFG